MRPHDTVVSYSPTALRWAIQIYALKVYSIYISQIGYQTKGMSLWMNSKFVLCLRTLPCLPKLLINFSQLSTKTASNCVICIGTTMSLSGIKGCLAQSFDNQKKTYSRDFACQRKDGTTRFFELLHYILYTQSKAKLQHERLTTVLHIPVIRDYPDGFLTFLWHF